MSKRHCKPPALRQQGLPNAKQSEAKTTFSASPRMALRPYARSTLLRRLHLWTTKAMALPLHGTSPENEIYPPVSGCTCSLRNQSATTVVPILRSRKLHTERPIEPLAGFRASAQHTDSASECPSDNWKSLPPISCSFIATN